VSDPALQKTLADLEDAHARAAADRAALVEEEGHAQVGRSPARIQALHARIEAADGTARAVLEDLGRLHPKLHALLATEPPSAKGIREALPPGVLVAEMFVGEEALHVVLVSREGGVRAVEVKVARAALEDTVFAFREALLRGGRTRGVQPLATLKAGLAGAKKPPTAEEMLALSARLHRWLIAPSRRRWRAPPPRC